MSRFIINTIDSLGSSSLFCHPHHFVTVLHRVAMALVWQLNNGNETGLKKSKPVKQEVAVTAGWYECYAYADANRGPRQLKVEWRVVSGNGKSAVEITSKKDTLVLGKLLSWFAFQVPANASVCGDGDGDDDGR
jgi:hypothetical protein